MTTLEPVYEAGDGWRFRIVAGNGEIIAVSSEAYTRQSDAQRGLDGLTLHVQRPVLEAITETADTWEREAGRRDQAAEAGDPVSLRHQRLSREFAALLRNTVKRFRYADLRIPLVDEDGHTQ